VTGAWVLLRDARPAHAIGPGAMNGLGAVVLATLAVWTGAFLGSLLAVLRAGGRVVEALPRAAGWAFSSAAGASMVAGLLVPVPGQSPIATALGLLWLNLPQAAAAAALGTAAGALGHRIRGRNHRR